MKIRPGVAAIVESDAANVGRGVLFEDDGETGYFYARDFATDQLFVDALHIYTLKTIVPADRERASDLRILWTRDWQRAALLLNNVGHAMFDFGSKGGYSLDEFPAPDRKSGWSRGKWEGDFKAFFYPSDV